MSRRKSLPMTTASLLKVKVRPVESYHLMFLINILAANINFPVQGNVVIFSHIGCHFE